MGGDRGVRQAGVRPALLLRHVGVQLGEALDVRLVDEGLVVGDGGAAVALPVEERVDDHAVGHVRRGVVVVAGVLVAEVVGEERLVPVDLAGRGLGVGVEEQLVGVAALALVGVPRAVDAVAVALAGLHGRDVAVPDVGVDLGDLEPRLGEGAEVVGVGVEQAQLDALGDLAEQGEVRAGAVEGGTQGVGSAGPGLGHALKLPATRRKSRRGPSDGVGAVTAVTAPTRGQRLTRSGGGDGDAQLGRDPGRHGFPRS